MLITEETFQAFLKCETKTFLKLSNGVGDQSEFGIWQRHVVEGFRKACGIKLRSNLRDDHHLCAPPLVQSIENSNCRLILDCVARSGEIQSNIHALERLPPSSGKAKHSPFVPIRFVPGEKVTKHDKLSLAFDALALSAATGKLPPFGKIMHGTGQRVVRVQLAGLMKTARSVVKKIAAQQAGGTPPQLILNKHCAECEFRERCRRIAVEKDDLSLLSSMSVAEVRRENSRGIFTVNQF